MGKNLQLCIDIFILIQDQSTYWNFSWLYTLEAVFFFACYPACGIPLPAAQNHNVRKLCFDNMDIKKGFSLSGCNSLTTTAINLQQSTAFFSAVTSCLKRANCSFCKAKCNLALQVYVTDKFILIC